MNGTVLTKIKIPLMPEANSTLTLAAKLGEGEES
jgi:hypothetical protein